MNGPSPLRNGAAQAIADMKELAKLTRDCAMSGVARRVLWLRVSSLPSALTRPHHMRLMESALRPLTTADRARSYSLPNGDIAIAWRGEAALAVATVTSDLTKLFADEKDAVDVAALVSVLELPAQADAVSTAITKSAVPPAARPAAVRPAATTRAPDPGAGAEAHADAGPNGHGATDRDGEPLDAAALAMLEHDLAQVNVSRFTRRKEIVERMPDGTFTLRWEKRYLAVGELIQSLAPNCEARVDPWLFRRLTRTLDRRMLALLAAPQELRDAGPFSLNLNVGSIVAPEFLRLDDALPAALRGRVVLDVLAADLAADPAAFMFARNFAQARGYRLLLRGVTADLLPVFLRTRPIVDLLQLRWSDALGGFDVADIRAEAPRIVLTRATPEGVAWARACGITLHQRLRSGGR